VLHAVEQGEVKAGFVYSTDARSANLRAANVKVVFAFESSTHPPIEYQAAALRGATNRDAAGAFLTYLHSESARARLVDAGFELP
jgi:molybdate transport system substrate-binding protein